MRVSLVSLLSVCDSTPFILFLVFFVLLLDRLGGFEAGVPVHICTICTICTQGGRWRLPVQQYPKTMALMGSDLRADTDMRDGYSDLTTTITTITK